MHSGHADCGEVMRVIEQGFGQLDFSLAQALITEWATSIMEGALIGGTGGGVIGSSSKQAGPTAAGAIIGVVVGGVHITARSYDVLAGLPLVVAAP